MIDLTKLTKETLQEPATLAEIEKETADLVFHLEIKDAYQLAKALEKILPELPAESDHYQKYQKIINQLKFVSFATLSNKEQEDLIKNHIIEVLEIAGFDLVDRVKGSVALFSVWQRDDAKKVFRQALLTNNQVITKAKLVSLKDGQESQISSTLANWLKDYNQTLGTEPVDSLAQSQYFSTSQNFKNLPEEEKIKLKKIFQLYEYLKRSSLSAEGFEDNLVFQDADGQYKVLKDGQIIELPSGGIKEPIKRAVEEKKETFPPLPKEYEKEDLAKAAPAGVSSTKEEELPNISSLISQARKEAEEKLAEASSAPLPIKSTTLTLEEVADQAERAISELKIILSPEEKNRLKNILVSFLKGIRDSIEIKDALLKSKEEGGLNFTPQQVEQIFNLIKKQKPLKEKSPVKEKTFGVSLDEQMKDVLRTPSEDVIARSPKSDEVVPKADLPQVDNLSEIATRPLNKLEVARNDKKEEALPQLQPPPPVILETFREKLKEKITSQPALSQLSSLSQESQISQPSRLTPPPPSLVEASYGGQSPPTDREGEHLLRRSFGVRRVEVPEIKEIKPRLEDIKRPSFSGRRPRVELVGPIEEIRNLTLADLREMSDSPDKAFEKIKGKISLLEKESFLKKIQAIKAWRESEIHRLYVEIGREVIQKKFIIAKILKERSAKGLPILTEEEFSAIMDFNKTLRF